MAFSFGGSSSAPAPFGSAAAAPAGGAFSFGGTPAPAPTGGAFGAAPSGFGSSTAPAPAPFGAPAPAGGGLFGSSSAPAPGGGGGLFGSNPAPASGGLFGSSITPAPAPFGSPASAPGGLFGSTTPAPSGGLFGSVPASGGLFGSALAAPTALSQPAPPPPNVSSQTPYVELPPAVKQAIDQIHELMMKHKRSMAQVQTMAPALLRETQPADVAAGTPASTLVTQLKALQTKMDHVASNLQASAGEAMELRNRYEHTTTQSIVHGQWPVQALASRRGVKLTKAPQHNNNQKSDPTINDQIRKSLELQAAHVDRLEKIPSPYMWQTLETMERRLEELKNTTNIVKSELQQVKDVKEMGIASVVQTQTNLLVKVAQSIQLIQYQMDDVRNKYKAWETNQNVLDQQKWKDLEAQQKRNQAIQMGFIKAAAQTNPIQTAPTPAPGGFGAPAPAGGSLFGSSSGGGLFGSAPAPSGGGLFGSSTPAPAPSGGSLFGSSTPAPAPSGGSLFGSSTPAPAPAGGSLFGSSTPAPAPGGGGNLFGAPAPAAPAFGATPAPTTPAFGATPAPAFGAAPAGGGLFGAPAPSAPASGFGFGTSSSSASKSKSKSRGSRRK